MRRDQVGASKNARSADRGSNIADPSKTRSHRHTPYSRPEWRRGVVYDAQVPDTHGAPPTSHWGRQRSSPPVSAQVRPGAHSRGRVQIAPSAKPVGAEQAEPSTAAPSGTDGTGNTKQAVPAAQPVCATGSQSSAQRPSPATGGLSWVHDPPEAQSAALPQ
jgi:hypothetical protein